MRLTILFLIASACFANTRIVDTITNPNHVAVTHVSLFTGTLTITGPFLTTAAGGVTYSGVYKEDFPIVNGALDVTLVPNDALSPAGTSYGAKYTSRNGVTRFEYWIVPTSGSTLKIPDVKVSTIPTPTLTLLLSQLYSSSCITGYVIGFNGTAFTCVAQTGGGAIANIHTTFSAASSVAMTVSGGSTLAAMPACFNTGVSPTRRIEPDHIEITDANTITVFFSGTYTGYCNVNVGSSSSTNTHATFSAASSVAVDLTGVSNASIDPGCWNTSVSPARLFEPDHVELTDSNTVTIFFSGTYTGYCNVNTGS